MKDIYDILCEWKQRRGERRALATLVRAEGSSYRRPGARMLICEDGKMVGSLSAGCLEEEVALRARDVLQTGKSVLMSFDTRKRFGCAGKIDIFIERAAEEFFVTLAENLDARRSCVAVTVFDGNKSGTQILEGGAPATPFNPQSRGSSTLQLSASVLMQQIPPRIRLVIMGEGPDNAPLHLLANSLGWETLEIAATTELPFVPDEWTAAIIKSHNYGRDFAALQTLLPLELRYVGLIGPRRRRNQLLGDLLDLGVTINAGFFAPAGLDLGSETPAEIALAIVSEIQRVFTGGSGESLRERKRSIHANATPVIPSEVEESRVSS
ncbi:MAG: XdhC family protein [Verrucomicrobia bacterium]|nr:XdhC family protein [Verrucomicrobiota bacterium]